MPQISAVIITHNEESNIGRAIRSLDSADEIIIVDDNSTDGTARIAAELGARVIAHPFEGFAAQKNFGVSQAAHDWILSLDGDEELNEDARLAIRLWKRAEPTAAVYRLARRARYLGRWILHSGWYPDRKIRLFDRRLARWQGDYVHESVVTAGRVETLPGEILHYTCDSLDEHRRRIEFYTDLAAREMLDSGQHPNALRTFVLPAWVFLNTYFVKFGILDGVSGFHIARMAARYVRRKYQKLAQMSRSAGDGL